MSRGAEARDRILERIRVANAEREAPDHPGDFGGWLAAPGGTSASPVARFVEHFTAVGGEVVPVDDLDAAAEWLETFAADFSGVAVGTGVPEAVVPDLDRMDAAEAGLAISLARAGVAETGSTLLDSRDGRRTQLLAGTHVVLLHEGDVEATLRETLRGVASDLPAALGLHSGPSKSADIGQVMVKGVHGPGRLIVLLVQRPPGTTT